MKLFKIAITMRHMIFDYGNNITEERDSISSDWGNFLSIALPNVLWFPIPNLGKKSINIAKAWGINGVILSGGESFGASIQRDETEFSLLSWARDNNLPVLGVCRGAQIIHKFLGGDSLIKVSEHVATKHMVICSNGRKRLVNSYHNLAIPTESLARNLIATEITEDKNYVEGFIHNSLNWRGIMWHPEREKELSKEDIITFSLLFGGVYEG